MAGLTAAAYLSRAGRKVLLCEKQKKTGGLVNSFEYKGFTFDGGIRSTENTGIVLPMLRQLGIEVEFLPNVVSVGIGKRRGANHLEGEPGRLPGTAGEWPMLRQLGIEVEFLPSPVSVGIGKDVVRVTSKDSLAAYRELLEKHFPDSSEDIAAHHPRNREGDGLPGRPLRHRQSAVPRPEEQPGYVFRTILPWLLKYLLTTPKIARLNKPVDEHLTGFTHQPGADGHHRPALLPEDPGVLRAQLLHPLPRLPVPEGRNRRAAAGARAVRAGHTAAKSGRETEIASVDPDRRRATDSSGNAYRYRKLVWAADQKTLYRLIDLSSLPKSQTAVGQGPGETAGAGGQDRGRLGLHPVPHGWTWTSRTSRGYPAATSSTRRPRPVFPAPAWTNCAARPASRRGSPPTRSVVFAWLKRFLQNSTPSRYPFPVLRDSSLAPEGKTGLIISVLFDYSLTKHIRAMGWYDEFKKLMSDDIVDVLDASIYPGLKAAVIDSFTSTPLTIEQVSGNSDGAITGWAFTNDSMPAVSKPAESSQLGADADSRRLPGRAVDVQPFRAADFHPDRQAGRGPGPQGPGVSPVSLRLISQILRPVSRSRAWAAGFSSMVRWKKRPLTSPARAQRPGSTAPRRR